MIEAFWVIFGLITVFIIWAVGSANIQEKKIRKEFLDQLKLLLDQLNNDDGYHFLQEKTYIGFLQFGGGFSGIAIDTTRKKLCLFAPYDNKMKHKIIAWDKLIEYEFKINDSTIKSSRQDVIGGAAVGAAVAGGVGALIGGFLGNNKSNKLITEIILTLYINDIDEPTFKIPFYQNIKGGDLSLPPEDLREGIRLTEHWEGMLKVILRDTES